MKRRLAWRVQSVVTVNLDSFTFCPEYSKSKVLLIQWKTKSIELEFCYKKEDMRGRCNRLLQSVWNRLLFDLNKKKVEYSLFNETLNRIPFDIRFMKRRLAWRVQSVVTVNLDSFTFCPEYSKSKVLLIQWNTKFIELEFWYKKEDMHGRCNRLLQSVRIRLLFDLSNSRVKYCLFKETLSPILFDFDA